MLKKLILFVMLLNGSTVFSAKPEDRTVVSANFYRKINGVKVLSGKTKEGGQYCAMMRDFEEPECWYNPPHFKQEEEVSFSQFRKAMIPFQRLAEPKEQIAISHFCVIK